MNNEWYTYEWKLINILGLSVVEYWLREAWRQNIKFSSLVGFVWVDFPEGLNRFQRFEQQKSYYAIKLKWTVRVPVYIRQDIRNKKVFPDRHVEL